jgi:hypothetical protein
MEEQKMVNEILCAENCTGRWLWKSGEIGLGSAVPWEIQTTNTCPENFIWEKGRTSVVTVAPGLYEVTLAFYSEKKPTAQLVVNGEPMLSFESSAKLQSSSAMDVSMRINQGNITGLSLIDFLSLPARARISITYIGDLNAEGFLGLRKL